MKQQAKLREGGESSAADQRWVHPQSNMREACARFASVVTSKSGNRLTSV